MTSGDFTLLAKPIKHMHIQPDVFELESKEDPVLTNNNTIHRYLIQKLYQTAASAGSRKLF